MAQRNLNRIQALAQILLELVLVMPVILLIAAYVSPVWSQVVLWITVISASAWLGFLIQSIFHLKKEGLWLTIFFIGTVGLYIVSSLHHGIPGLLLYTLGYVTFARGFKVASSPVQASAYIVIYSCGLAVHALLFLVSMSRAEWRQLQPLLAVLGIIALFSVTFLLNRHQLVRANYSDMNQVAVPKYVLRMNTRYVVIFLGSIFIIATLLFSSMMDRLWQALRDWLNTLLSRENKPQQEPVSESPAGSSEWLPAVEEQSPSPFWEWLEKLVGVVVSIVLICGVIVLMLWLCRNLIQRWFPRLWALLRRLLTQERGESPAMEYEDEHFSLLQWEKLKNELKLPLHHLFRYMQRKPERISDYHTNRDRIRFLYRSKVREAATKGYAPEPSLTPKEILANLADRSANPEENMQLQQLTELYNTARYSTEEIEDEQVHSLLDRIKEDK